MRIQLTEVSLKGYKTFADMAGDHRLIAKPLNVLIGPNGAGKSNFISFFRMLSWALSPPGKLQEYVATQGGASSILTDGPENCREIEAHVCIATDGGENEYAFRLVYAADDTLLLTEEKYRYIPNGVNDPVWKVLPAGQREAHLVRESESGNKTARVIHNLLRRIIVYQFHNTSATARIRNKWSLDEGNHLKEDAGNLAPVLYRLQNLEPEYYHRIVETIRLTLPFFEDFDLSPEYGSVLLRWREKYCNRTFSASQAGDGMLRVMSLFTLLLLPEKEFPNVIILDEPELGLHPQAIHLLGGLIRSVATHTQVIVATQSLPLLDTFDPEDIVVVDRNYGGWSAPRVGRYSRVTRLEADKFSDWLEEYSLSELWEKNVLGGRP